LRWYPQAELTDQSLLTSDVAVVISTFARRFQTLLGELAAAMQINATTAIVNLAARVITAVLSILSSVWRAKE